MRYKLKFSSLASLIYVTRKNEAFEAVYTPDGVEIYIHGTQTPAVLPEHVGREIKRLFAEIHCQDAYAREQYLMAAKPCLV
jgi:hypothetical protein